ncbi:uncharacterized protein LOC106151970 [Lingula anatina]|uniref:Uncharacterized protein LOC106151970 n=1 Tax=Lingula anatina TaxID=7574 RepID=A0A1S3H4I7_LINAN|nr:uncharacterized protein LOC106151970 [Lingula anatina]|eukprot:XP_013380877.1 uncharacterized protein LOC106151970 [Lingula anatina]
MNSVQFVKDETFVRNGADDTVQSPQTTKTDVNRHNRQTADTDDNSVKKTSQGSGIAEVVNAMADSCCSQKALDMSNKSAHTDEVDAFSVLYEKIMDELETTDDGEYGTFSRKRKPRHQACSRDHIQSETREQAADPSSQEQPSKSMKTQQNLSGQTPCSGAGHIPINSLHEVTITTTKCDLASESQCKLQSTPRNKHLNKIEHVSNHNNGVLCSPEHLVDKPNNAPSLCNVIKSAKDDGLGGATERVKWSAKASSPEGAIGATDPASPGGASEINSVSPGAECAARDTSNLENDNFVREKDIISDNNDSLSNDTRFHLFSCDINIDVNDTNAEDKTANSDEIKKTPITENQCEHDQYNRSDDTPDSKPHSETQDVMNRHSSSFSPSECGDVDIPERLAEHIGYDGPNECASGGKYSPLGMLEKTEPSKSEIPCTPLWRLDVTSSDRVWALRAADMSDFSDADTESISSQDTIMTMSTLTEQSSFIEECNKENGATEKDPINKNILASDRSVDEDTTDENKTSNSNNNNNDYKMAGCCSSVLDGCHGNSACRETFSEQTISEKPNKEATEAAVSAVHYLCKKDVSLHKTDNYRYSKQHVKTAPAEQHVLTAIKTNFGYVDRSKVPSFRQMNAELRKSLTDMAGVERGAQSARKSPTEPLCIESKADIDDAIAEKAARKENSLTTSSPKDGAIHVNVTSSVEMKASHDRGSVSRADKVLPPASNDTAQSGAKEARKSHESCQATGG